MRFETKQVSIIPECRVDTGGMKIYIPFSKAALTILFDDARRCDEFTGPPEALGLRKVGGDNEGRYQRNGIRTHVS